MCQTGSTNISAVQMAAEITNCPHCGIVLRVETRTENFTVYYDFDEWRRRCNDPDLGTPTLCLTQGTTPGERELKSKQTEQKHQVLGGT